MKTYYVAANILGAAEIKAKSAEEAHKIAESYLSKRFKIQPKPTGLWVFEKAPTNDDISKTFEMQAGDAPVVGDRPAGVSPVAESATPSP